MADLEYEPRDVDVRAVVKAGLGLGGLTVFGVALSLGAFLLLERMEKESERPLPPLAHEPGRLPPEPRLQSAPQADIQHLRAQERQRLSSYGWVDPQGKVVHIPIEEAMKLYAERAAGRSVAPVPAPAFLPMPASAAGASGTASLPPGAPPPSPSASPARPRSGP